MTHDAETIERVAAAMWREEVVRAGAPESVAMRRTSEAFRDTDNAARAKWCKFARAALSALPPQEVMATSGAEQNWIDHMELSCTSCGGSGHKDDQTPQEVSVQEAEHHASLRSALVSALELIRDNVPAHQSADVLAQGQLVLSEGKA